MLPLEACAHPHFSHRQTEAGNTPSCSWQGRDGDGAPPLSLLPSWFFFAGRRAGMLIQSIQPEACLAVPWLVGRHTMERHLCYLHASPTRGLCWVFLKKLCPENVNADQGPGKITKGPQGLGFVFGDHVGIISSHGRG